MTKFKFICFCSRPNLDLMPADQKSAFPKITNCWVPPALRRSPRPLVNRIIRMIFGLLRRCSSRKILFRTTKHQFVKYFPYFRNLKRPPWVPLNCSFLSSTSFLKPNEPNPFQYFSFANGDLGQDFFSLVSAFTSPKMSQHCTNLNVITSIHPKDMEFRSVQVEARSHHGCFAESEDR